MGNPDLYYKRMLQEFAYDLICLKDQELANKWLEEDSIEKLEECIIEIRNSMDEMRFVFQAGISAQSVINEVYDKEDTYQLNACIGGFTSFEDFIGVYDADDEEDE